MGLACAACDACVVLCAAGLTHVVRALPSSQVGLRQRSSRQMRGAEGSSVRQQELGRAWRLRAEAACQAADSQAETRDQGVWLPAAGRLSPTVGAQLPVVSAAAGMELRRRAMVPLCSAHTREPRVTVLTPTAQGSTPAAQPPHTACPLQQRVWSACSVSASHPLRLSRPRSHRPGKPPARSSAPQVQCKGLEHWLVPL